MTVSSTAMVARKGGVSITPRSISNLAMFTLQPDISLPSGSMTVKKPPSGIASGGFSFRNGGGETVRDREREKERGRTLWHSSRLLLSDY